MKRDAFMCFVFWFVAVAFIFGTARQAQSDSKILELTHSSQFLPTHPMSQPVRDWAEEIKKKTNGRVNITVYFAGTLTSPAACYEGVVRGQSDIGEVVLSMTRGRFPLMEAVELPGFPFNAIVTSKVSHEFYRKFKPKELDETHLLYLHSHIPGAFHTRTKAVRKLEDLKGLRTRCTGLSAKIVQALGGTPVTMPKAETYDGLSRGLLDAAMGAPNDQTAFKIYEVTKYCTLYAPAGNVATFATVINKAKWNSLPPDIQRIFTEVSEAWVEHTGKVWNNGELETIEFFKARKEDRFILIPEEEGARWDKALVTIFDAYKNDMAGKNLPGKEALKYRQELIEKYSKTYPALKTN